MSVTLNCPRCGAVGKYTQKPTVVKEKSISITYECSACGYTHTVRYPK